jgi:Asp-tRNA(Asn)/Glu-tRNA(Gln) amidotransferase C subunit
MTGPNVITHLIKAKENLAEARRALETEAPHIEENEAHVITNLLNQVIDLFQQISQEDLGSNEPYDIEWDEGQEAAHNLAT